MYLILLSFLHLSYRINFNKWQVRPNDDKEMLANTKLYCQNSFWFRLGLIGDESRRGGSGISNEGNLRENSPSAQTF